MLTLIQFLSTLSLRRATNHVQTGVNPTHISIHALLAESDHSRRSRKQRHPNFYPRSPCGERPPRVLRHCTTYLFLSTLSLRRATPRGGALHYLIPNFYPRSPCGERQVNLASLGKCFIISIHALLAESDNSDRRFIKQAHISIHALLAESDV